MVARLSNPDDRDIRAYWSRRLAEEEEHARRARSPADRAAYLKACSHLRALIAGERPR
ncbi:MAG: hypothetical protein ABIO29_05985 [Sphingomicrobium sp.]